MGGALPLYQQYWSIVTNEPRSGNAQQRKREYDKRINDAIEAEKEKEMKKATRQHYSGLQQKSEL
jgi:DNA-binding FadR family transcriptional regulator